VEVSVNATDNGALPWLGDAVNEAVGAVAVGVVAGGVDGVGVWDAPAGRNAVTQPASGLAEVTFHIHSAVFPAASCRRKACSEAGPRAISHDSVHPVGGVRVDFPAGAPTPPTSMVPFVVVVTPGTASRDLGDLLRATDTVVSTGCERSTPS
jgi:hypothetical protein